MNRNKYQRLSIEDKELIKKWILEGKSLRDIVKLTGLGITTIYYQVRKFKPKQRKEFIVKLNDFQIGELVGAFAGDGSHTYLLNDKNDIKRGRQHRIRYHLCLKDDFRYAQYLKYLLSQMNLNVHLYKRQYTNVVDVAISSVSYLEFLKKHLQWEKDKTFSIRLKNKIESHSEDFLRGFARGLMDTDGFLNPANAVCACISQRLIDNLSEIFTKLGMEITRTITKPGGNRRDLFYVRVRRKSLDKYEKIIGFSNQYKKML